jgi:hypothetical protein
MIWDVMVPMAEPMAAGITGVGGYFPASSRPLFGDTSAEPYVRALWGQDR